MIDPTPFQDLRLRGGFVLRRFDFVNEPMADALGRPAIARTHIVGRQLEVSIRRGLSDTELSVTLYHEILEAMTVAVTHPPKSVQMFNEGDFERAAYQAHAKFGEASPQNIDAMLQSYGF